MERIITGIKKCDEMIEGGFPKGSIQLITGAPGTGKTIFCLQTIYNNAKNGKKCVYISFEQRKKDILEQMAQLGMTIDNLPFKENLRIISIPMDEDEKIFTTILEEIQNKNDLLVLDSMSSLAVILGRARLEKKTGNIEMSEILESVVYPISLTEFDLSMRKIKNLFDIIKMNDNLTTLVISKVDPHSNSYSKDKITEHFCDGILFLKSTILNGLKRTLEIPKIRKTKITGGDVSFDITSKGIEIL